MAHLSDNNYYFLNREGRWPGFQWSGLQLSEDGAIGLTPLPSLSDTLPDSVKSAASPDGPAGIAIDLSGNLYFSDPDDNRVRRILSCDQTICAAPCMGGSIGQPTSLNAPRGLLVPQTRSALFVVDSGNHRIQIFDLESFQLVGSWGQANLSATPQPGSAPGQFNTPWTLAGDSAGNIYVVDYGNQRVQKFNEIGEVVPSFVDNVSASGLLVEPSDIAVCDCDGVAWIFVVDASNATVALFDAEGRPLLDSNNNPRVLKDAHLTQPGGIAAAGDALYVGDNAANRVLQFHVANDFTYVGTAIGYQGPVAALLLDGHDGLWVHPGGALTPIRLDQQKGYAKSGALFMPPDKPFMAGNGPVVWHRVLALAGKLPANAHLDLYAYASNDLANPPAVDPNALDPFADSKWQSINYTANLDVTDLYVGGLPAKFLWIGALFSGDGTASAQLRQLRVEFNYPAYQQYLPAIYRNTTDCGEFLNRFLSLCEAFFSRVEHEIDFLPALFDPKASPERFLAWLAGCVGLELDSNWDLEKQRQIIAEIFRLSGKRGTAAGLRESLRLFAGVDAVIEEPLLNAAWWCLPNTSSCCDSCASAAASSADIPDGQDSRLGWTTMLAPAQPQGAVVGTTAILDQSQLITDGEYGAPLFSDVAYQFSVEVYRSQVMSANALARIQAVVEQEKPAHTAYHLCIIDPRFRVGFQSRLGIDTVVGGEPRSLSLGTAQALGQDTVLAGMAPSLLGTDSTLGVSTRLA